ncbi:MAG: rhomboid family intramembrane serine protease [Planctomycetota bacterium]
MKHQIRDEFRYVLIFVAVIWAVFIVDTLVPAFDLNQWGLVPRQFGGLLGIPLMPFLHGGVGHIASNTVPLVVLLVLMAGSRTRTWETVAEITILGGALLWIFGRSQTSSGQTLSHVGASGLIYGLIAFLIVAGFREKRILSLVIALGVGFFFGATLLFGVIPRNNGVSWDGHLCGAIAGAALAYLTLGKNRAESTES